MNNNDILASYIKTPYYKRPNLNERFYFKEMGVHYIYFVYKGDGLVDIRFDKGYYDAYYIFLQTDNVVEGDALELVHRVLIEETSKNLNVDLLISDAEKASLMSSLMTH